jgi:integrase
MKKAAERHLWNRGVSNRQNWYLRLPIPKPLRKHFARTKGGTEPLSIIEPLDTGDLAVARRKRDELTVAYRRVFDRLEAGEAMTPEEIKAAASLDLGAVVERARSGMLTTLDGHRLRVRALVDHCGDVPLASVTRAMAADFLVKIATRGLSNRTVNNYATTLASIFKSARYRGRFIGDNPFEGQKRKAGGESYSPFETAELQTLFGSLAFEVKPAAHTPETALPWVSLIAAFTGMRLEEIAQLSAADIREQGANGATVTVIDIHNGGNNALKNAASARLVPIHSELVRAGLLQYRDSLPKDGPLFPGLVRRASKGGKVGARLGELFRDKLESLGLKRELLCFHSFRHTAAERLEAAAVSQTDAARVLGHTIAGMSYGVYSSGPGLKRLAAVVESIEYPGLKLAAAKAP